MKHHLDITVISKEISAPFQPIQIVVSILVGLILIFVLGGVGTWFGITQLVQTRPALLLITAIVIIWLVLRTKLKCTWHNTPLDRILPLWIAAFVVSTAANLPQQQHIVVGLWFAGLYILIWYIAFDALSNRMITADTLLNGIIIAGICVLISALFELISHGTIRVSGMLQNPNYLGAFQIIFIPILLSRIEQYGGKLFWLYMGLLVGALVFLVLSQSRGGMLGVIYSWGLVRFRDTRVLWTKIVILIVGILIAIMLFNIRGDSGRIPIYIGASKILTSRLLTGQGLFTFRRSDHQLITSTPYISDGQNLHAHNILLQIGVELGFGGILASALTVLQFIRQTPIINYQRWCIAAGFGLLIQQIGDFTIMVPSIALCTILIACIASYKVKSCVDCRSSRQPICLLTLFAILLISLGWLTGAISQDLLH